MISESSQTRQPTPGSRLDCKHSRERMSEPQELELERHFGRAMRYQLFYRQHLVASIEEKNAEFPSFFGHYQLQLIADVPELAQVRAYIDFCVRVSPLREQECFDDPAMLQEEESFTDLIQSHDWSLVDAETQQRIPILIPIFFTDGVTWSLNPHYPDINTHETA